MGSAEEKQTVSLMRMADVIKKTSLSRSTINRFRAKGEFPRPIIIAEGITRWTDCEVDAWITLQIKTCRRGGKMSPATSNRSGSS